MKLSRRYFLKGVAASAVGAAAGSVLEANTGNAQTIASPSGTKISDPSWLGKTPVINNDQIADT